MDESALVRASQAGDKSAFGRLVDGYYKSIYRLAYSHTGRGEEADDVCQETFFRAFSSIGKLRDGGSFRRWLFVIALNLLRKRIRQFKRHKQMVAEISGCNGGEATADESGRPFQRLSGKERAAIVHQQLRQMPEQMRSLTILILMEGLKQKEAAAIVNCSEATASRQLEMARNLLRIRLRKCI